MRSNEALTIGQVTALTGVPASTLRYWEGIGLLSGVRRDASGRRAFAEGDVEWVGFVLRLRESGMPLADMVAYAKLRGEGDSTKVARLTLLKSHRDELERRIAMEQEHARALDTKIAWYEERIQT